MREWIKGIPERLKEHHVSFRKKEDSEIKLKAALEENMKEIWNR